MIVVANRFRVTEEYAEAFVDRFRERVGAIEDRPGFVRLELLVPERGETHVVKTYWESMADFEAWTDSKAFERAHDRDPPEGMYTARPELEIHEVALETGAGT